MFIAYLVGYVLNGAFKSASPRQCVANIVCCILWPVMLLLAVAIWAYTAIFNKD
jgi:hypothetical protein